MKNKILVVLLLVVNLLSCKEQNHHIINNEKIWNILKKHKLRTDMKLRARLNTLIDKNINSLSDEFLKKILGANDITETNKIVFLNHYWGYSPKRKKILLSTFNQITSEERNLKNYVMVLSELLRNTKSNKINDNKLVKIKDDIINLLRKNKITQKKLLQGDSSSIPNRIKFNKVNFPLQINKGIVLYFNKKGELIRKGLGKINLAQLQEQVKVQSTINPKDIVIIEFRLDRLDDFNNLFPVLNVLSTSNYNLSLKYILFYSTLEASFLVDRTKGTLGK